MGNAARLEKGRPPSPRPSGGSRNARNNVRTDVGLGVYLAIGLFVQPAAIFGCALIVVFVAAMTQAAVRGLSLDCGSFGSLAAERVGPGTILRDAALGVPSLVLAVWPARLLSVDRAWLGRPDCFARAVPALR